jgi:hypothetical protein
MVYKGKTVVYELCQQSIVYVISPNGIFRRTTTPASLVNVPELENKETVHIYDAKSSLNQEPCESNAYLIEFSSRNSRNYAQTIRRYGMEQYCIPSYEVEELLLYSDLFGVPPEEARRRCSLVGPSMRYVLINDFETSLASTVSVAKRVKAEQMEEYISDTLYGEKEDSSACLVLAIVNEQDYLDPNDAYKEKNIKWEIASTYLAKIIFGNSKLM